MEQSLIDAEDSGIYQNLNETSRVRDVNDILGPLPQIPSGFVETDKIWSRRVSGFSEIYEEIIDPSSRFVCRFLLMKIYSNRRTIFRSRIGRDSAIYEEMRLNRPVPNSSPPPLPPRTRKNTDCSSLQRSYTTPESEMVKKKWNLFENVFGKSKRSETKRRERPVQPAQARELQLLKAKRNSFSSPDLSHLDVSFNNSDCSNCSFDLENPTNISSSNSYELENLCEDEAEHLIEDERLNVSRHIQPNFELHLDSNMSSVNLVGSNYNLSRFEDSSPKSQPATSPPGYLEMRPGRGFDMKKVEELDNQIKNDVLYRLKYSFDSPITYKREFDYDKLPPTKEIIYTNERLAEPHYVCMTKGTRVSPLMPLRTTKSDEPTYMPMIRLPTVALETHQNVANDQIESTKINCVSSKNKRHSVDEKIASYYPYYDVPSKCNGSPSVRISTSEHALIKRSPPKIISPELVQRLEMVNSSPVKIPLRKGKRIGSFNLKSLNDNNNNGHELSPEISKKYATISRISVKNTSDDHHLHHHHTPTTIKKSGSVSPTSIKRFTSLPRFKKIDFSPLRLKISSVLQRNNSSGC